MKTKQLENAPLNKMQLMVIAISALSLAYGQG